MEGISPVNVPVLHESDIGIIAVVFFLKETVVEARVDHKQDIVKIQGMSNGMFVEKDLFLVFAELF